MIQQGEPLYLTGNDDRPLVVVTTRSTTTGAVIAATGLSSLTFHLAATPTGSAINAAVSKSASEIGTTGYYTAVFEGADIVTYLASYAGSNVYQVFGDAANVQVVIARLVVALRTTS